MAKLSKIDRRLASITNTVLRCSSLIRRVVATSRSKAVRLQSWVVGDSHIVTRTTERTRTLHFGGIHPRYRTEYFLIEIPLLQPALFSRSGFIVSLFRASCERCLMTLRDAAESIHSNDWINSSEPCSYWLTFCWWNLINKQSNYNDCHLNSCCLCCYSS